MLKGVNLGNWLVLEKWMSPGLFAGTSAEDEVHLWRELSETARRERLTVHRDSWITDRDFVYLAANGIELVRIPVPYFIFGDVPPYIGCIDYLDRAFAWAQRRGMKILIDLHTVPGSQNGFDNGGICGVCTFHKKPENVEFALSVLERLATRYREHPSLWGIQVLNEPISQEIWDIADIPTRYPAVDPEEAAGSEPVPTEFLKQFYRDAYQRIRAQAPDVTVVFHDGFRIEEWKGFFTAPDFENVILDTHLYLMMLTWSSGDRALDEYVALVADRFASSVREAARDVPVMIGEWCLDTASKKSLELTDDERASYFRTIADVQLRAWEPAVAWTYWSYKLQTDDPLHDPWDMGRVIELGWLPEDLAASAD
ncbi:MAG: glucan 1,3-beta-glucosidase [Chloroflexota bacterium]|jgi:glucan 1,3-beta-glucosidase|nr:glucan 1,3-beta-glucosidase [Chloroflexota bacterium]